MSKLLDYAQGVVLLIALAMALIFGLAMTHYRDKAQETGEQLRRLQADVATRNTEAQAKLDELTAKRDALQNTLDTLHSERETTDAANTEEIARLAGELDRRPVRVRLVPQASACGPRGGGTASEAAASTSAGAADTAQTHGLLPASNAASLGRVIQEAETINAAYTSCRTTLIQSQALEATP